jgi:hypothetical protein
MQDGIELTPHLPFFVHGDLAEGDVFAARWTDTHVTRERVGTAAETNNVDHV